MLEVQLESQQLCSQEEVVSIQQVAVRACRVVLGHVERLLVSNYVTCGTWLVT